MIESLENMPVPQPNPHDPIIDTVQSDKEIEALLAVFAQTPEAQEIQKKFDAGVVDEVGYQQLMLDGATRLAKSK